MREKLYKSSNDKKLFGVCGGIAEYFGFKSSIVRLLWVVSVIVYGAGFLPYIVCAILMPKRDYIVYQNNEYDNINI